MADETKASQQAPIAPKDKVLRYVGPGSDSRKKEKMPLISNLPHDLGEPRLGLRKDMIRADELPAHYIEYVMATNTAAKGWWV